MNSLAVLQYIQGNPNDPLLLKRIEKMWVQMKKLCPFKIVYRLFPLHEQTFASIHLEGKLATQMLASCSQICLLAATLGFPFEQELKRLSHTNMADALLWDACGSAYLEACLDEWTLGFENKMKPLYCTDRFSCGYGDLPLALQPKLIALLQATPKLGLYTLPSHMLFPTKSVSAFIGISQQKQPKPIQGCSSCSLQEACPYRKEGRICYGKNS